MKNECKDIILMRNEKIKISNEKEIILNKNNDLSSKNNILEGKIKELNELNLDNMRSKDIERNNYVLSDNNKVIFWIKNKDLLNKLKSFEAQYNKDVGIMRNIQMERDNEICKIKQNYENTISIVWLCLLNVA